MFKSKDDLNCKSSEVAFTTIENYNVQEYNILNLAIEQFMFSSTANVNGNI